MRGVKRETWPLIHVLRLTFQEPKMQILNDKKNRAVIRVFTACTPAHSLLETTVAVEKSAAVGVRFLLSPVGSSFERFQNLQQRGEKICRPVKSISRGWSVACPKMHGESGDGSNRSENSNENAAAKKFIAPGVF